MAIKFKKLLNNFASCFWLALLYIMVKILPYSYLMAIGRKIGLIAYHCIKKRKKIAIANLQYCFPHLTQKEIIILAKKNFASLGMGVMEAGISWWSNKHKFNIEIIDKHLFYDKVKQNKGLILLGPHNTSLEIFGRVIAKEYKVFPVYKKLKNSVFSHAVMNGRKKLFGEIINNTDIRKIVQVLKNNQVIWIAPDQDHGIKHSSPAKFFNKIAATITSPCKLAKMTSSNILGIYYYRCPTKTNSYIIKFVDFAKNMPSDDINQDLNLINKFLEDCIKQNLEQYYWIHRRFKTRFDGQNNKLYEN